MASPVRTIAQGTVRSALHNKFLLGLLALDLIIVWMGPVLEFLPKGEKYRIIYDVGLATTAFFTMAVGVFLAGWTFPEEIEHRRIYLVLSKPVTRGEFFIGKVLGLLSTGFMATAIMGIFIVLIITLKFKQPPWPVLLALYMNSLELVVIIAIALFYSVWSSGPVAVMLSVATYLVGHASPTLQALGSKSSSEFLPWITNALYLIVPNLETFNVRYYVTHKIHVPAPLTAWATLYALAYAGLILCITFRIFLRREL